MRAVPARLPELTVRDEHRLRRRAQRLRGGDAEGRARLEAEIARAEERLARRRASVPAVTYPPELPVTERREDLLAAIRDHQVVVVAGETGSGKTTQLPKMCLELGRGVRGAIAHTQPRRLAARTVAERIADELGVPLGEAVGYAVRFSDRSREDTLVRLMTDGLLLAEMQHDPLLRRYDTIIVDEAHERSLNIDFLLGYLARILPRRPDLKLIITSATIDPRALRRHFGGAPVVEVSGRTYPVEVRYRPLEDADDPDRDQTDAIGDAVEELLRERAGDVLVFLSGEREIRDTAEALGGRLRDRRRDPAALRAALHARAAARLQAARRAPRRARHQRRRDVADRARHPLRRRSRHGADQPLQRAAEGAAAADRADLAGLGRPAQGPLRARRRRHLHPPLRRGGLRGAPALHRPGDPAHEPRVGDPADGRAGPRRRRGLPVPRPARPAPGPRRRSGCCRSWARSTTRSG